MDPALWELLDFTKVRVFDLSVANWYGKFCLPVNPEKLPALQYLPIEFSDSSAEQEIDLSRLNSFPWLVALSFDFEIEGGKFPETLTLPPSLKHVNYLWIGSLADGISFSKSCKEKILF